MKIAVISDLHGNIVAAENAIKDIKSREIHTIICLGDLVGYGAYPNETVELIKNEKILCIKGNYDASVVDNKFSYIRDTEINKFSLPYAVEKLSEENRTYLNNLPTNITLTFEDKGITFVHGSTRTINEYLIEGSNEAEEVMKEFKGDILVCAHTHIPYLKKYNKKLLINDGSIGKPKFGRPNSSYVILNVEKDMPINIEFIEIEYNYEEVVCDMKLKGFPEKLIKSYETGIE